MLNISNEDFNTEDLNWNIKHPAHYFASHLFLFYEYFLIYVNTLLSLLQI